MNIDKQQKETLIKLDNVCMSFNNKNVLENISFEVQTGQILTLIGPNGAGKTTLLKLILGILSPDKGKIIKNKNIKIGYVPQKTKIPVSIPLTVRRFLCLDGRYDEKTLCDGLIKTGLDIEILDCDIHPLSGGQLQRVLLARTLLKKPDLLILDEPVQGLDPLGEEQFYELLNQINRTKKCAIIMVSHDLHVVMASTHRVLCINHHICCSGTPDEIVNLSEYRHLYGKEPTLAFYQHHHNHLHLPNGRIKYVD